MQEIELAPIAAERVEQPVVTRQLRARLRGLLARRQLAAQIEAEQVDFGRRHDEWRWRPFGQWSLVARRIEAQLPHRDVRRLALRHVLPEGGTPGGVGDEVDADVVGGILHAMQPPVVEEPRLARGHVHGLPAAVELHLGSRNHGNVQAHPAEPVVVDVGVLGDIGVRIEPHEARAAPHHAEARQDLPQIGRLTQVRRRRHRAIDIVVLGATDADQPHGAIALDLVRVLGPGARGQRRHLGAHALHVEAHGQTKEWLGQSHAVLTPAPSRRGNRPAPPRERSPPRARPR